MIYIFKSIILLMLLHATAFNWEQYFKVRRYSKYSTLHLAVAICLSLGLLKICIFY